MYFLCTRMGHIISEGEFALNVQQINTFKTVTYNIPVTKVVISATAVVFLTQYLMYKKSTFILFHYLFHYPLRIFHKMGIFLVELEIFAG